MECGELGSLLFQHAQLLCRGKLLDGLSFQVLEQEGQESDCFCVLEGRAILIDLESFLGVVPGAIVPRSLAREPFRLDVLRLGVLGGHGLLGKIHDFAEHAGEQDGAEGGLELSLVQVLLVSPVLGDFHEGAEGAVDLVPHEEHKDLLVA